MTKIVTLFGTNYVGLVAGACTAKMVNPVVCVDVDGIREPGAVGDAGLAYYGIGRVCSLGMAAIAHQLLPNDAGTRSVTTA